MNKAQTILLIMVVAGYSIVAFIALEDYFRNKKHKK